MDTITSLIFAMAMGIIAAWPIIFILSKLPGV